MMIGSYHKNLLISFLVSSRFFHSHVQKKSSSDWIWVKFVCNLSPFSFNGEKSAFLLKAVFMRTCCGEGLDFSGLGMAGGWGGGSNF